MEVDSPMGGTEPGAPMQTDNQHDDSMNTTITQSTIQAAMPDYHSGQFSASQHSQTSQHSHHASPHENNRPHTSYSDTGFHSRPYSHSMSQSDVDNNNTPPHHYRYSQSGKPSSRPPSAMSGTSQGGYAYQQESAYAAQEQNKQPKVIIKVGMVGDAQIGKTSLMVKYVEGSWDEDYIQTLGVNFMEKTISIRNTEVTFSIWDLGGQREFVNMLPLVCNDAVAILFMFDLTRKSTLNSIKEWYRQGRGFNKTAIPFLVGTKYDTFVSFPREEQEEISNQAKRFAKAMKASLIFSSTSHSINVQKIFKIVLSKAFDLRCTIPEIENVGEPLVLYQSV
ncbi:septum-promoting GTP-binding protein 1 [Verruconis gallopava]|uniref:Septum-promoting GTP-binding protein 1 n=1 Tax=Verruconis gallopava TaxID=253628 RepID=A0A0D1XB28_9PEZI|nr:septum-promoting GTP-binding protein 1 [Verruconis gallopava]KIV99425.1 septum-promoting GTP-binding protein 1 [Verruconis gallopava]